MFQVSSDFDSCVYAKFEIRRDTLLAVKKDITDEYSRLTNKKVAKDHYEELKTNLNAYPWLVNAILKNGRYFIDDTINSREYSKRLYERSLSDRDLWFSIKQFHHGSESVIKCLRNPATRNKIIQNNGHRLAAKQPSRIPKLYEDVGDTGETLAGQILPRVIPGKWRAAGKLVWPDYTVFGVTPDYVKYELGTVSHPFEGNPIGISEVKSTRLKHSRDGLRPTSAQRWLLLTRKKGQKTEFTKKTGKKVPTLDWLGDKKYKILTDEVNKTIVWKSVVPMRGKEPEPQPHETYDYETGFIIGNLSAGDIFATPIVGKTWCQTVVEMISIANLSTAPVIEGVIVFVNLSTTFR